MLDGDQKAVTLFIQTAQGGNDPMLQNAATGLKLTSQWAPKGFDSIGGVIADMSRIAAIGIGGMFGRLSDDVIRDLKNGVLESRPARIAG